MYLWSVESERFISKEGSGLTSENKLRGEFLQPRKEMSGNQSGLTKKQTCLN